MVISRDIFILLFMNFLKKEKAVYKDIGKHKILHSKFVEFLY